MVALLDDSQNETFHRLLPVIVCMAVVGAVGIIGNILTIVFYASKSKRSTSTLQITCLAVVDLIVCIMIVPNIIEMVVNVKYNQDVFCKLTHVFGLWAIATSCFILWIIAIDRYRKICKPFAKQITVKTTKFAITVIVIGSFLLSVRNFVNFSTVEVNVTLPVSNETTIGCYCTTRGDAGYNISVTVFYAIDFLFVMVCLISIIVTYSHIIITLLKLKRSKNASNQHRRDITWSRPNATGTGNCVNEESDNSFGMTTFKSESHISDSDAGNNSNVIAAKASVCDGHPAVTIGNDQTFHNTSLRRTIQKKNFRKRKRRRKIGASSASERNLTFMMLAVSLLFVACFFPFFVVKIILRLVLKTGEEIELNVGIQFALRLVYMNSVFNPIVYCFFNPQFRRYIKGLFLKCFRCQKQTA
ncbi:putative neuropeptide Y receptor type 6 [Ruditapes philippinarum]|uniref:putative neuropeptide Y receptor type 6 n=1 Tax=Ruditapes philippinarum TaxID=129788 RepID=UPI00295B6D41|nr:putative neuropeptide Y receptor type 6 [Ruditapes philippinarum]